MDGRMRVVSYSLIAGALTLGSTLWLSCKTANRAPGVPAVPNGPSSGVNDSLYAFTSIATDPEGDGICYRFDWGDGDTSDWTDWVQSGQSGVATHAWSEGGSFTVKAQAKDAGERLSSWSGGHVIGVGTSWRRNFGGNNDDGGDAIQQTSDGGYIVAGWTFSYGAGSEDVWLIKADASGDKVWDRTYGGTDNDGAHSIQQTSDGGYIVAGCTESYGAGIEDAWLIKVDASGDKVWDRTFGGASYDIAYSVQQTADGGYIIAGYTESYGAGGDAWLIKVDASGDKVWDRTFGGTDNDGASSVQQTADGGFIVAGTTGFGGTSIWDAWLIKIDASGDKVWDRTFGGADFDWANSVLQTSDGGYIVAGGATSYGAGSEDAWLIKVDASGDKVWDRTYGGTDNDRANSVQLTSDGGYIVAGNTDSYGAGSSDYWLVKVDASGYKEWDKTYGGTGLEEARWVQRTSDGGYIITGRSWSYTEGSSDVWLVKTNANGE